MSDQRAFKLVIESGGIAHLFFDLPGEKVNKLSEKTLIELNESLDEVEANKSVKVLVIRSSKEGIFIAGADLNRFQTFFSEKASAEEMLNLGHQVLNRLQNFSFPTIALIDGACLGGGLELALACTYRIVTDHPKTLLGLPEVNLGIFPGWGGTQRLPRRVGYSTGVQMILSGKPVNGIKAYKIGLAEEIIASEFKEEGLAQFIHQLMEGNLPKSRKKPFSKRFLDDTPIGRALVNYQAKKTTLQQTKGHYPAPLAALRVIRRTFSKRLSDGLIEEKRAFIDGMNGEAFKCAPNLLRVFFNQEIVKKDPGLQEVALEPHAIEMGGVIGAGTMGNGIAGLFAYRGIPVRMKEIGWKEVAKGTSQIWKTFQSLVKRKKMSPREADLSFLKVGGCIDYSGFSHADIVIEAATENLEIKKTILKELEQNVSKHCVIATNTSSLTLDQLEKEMLHPERLVGMHFFNPPGKMPLVEVIQTKQTDLKAISTAIALCQRFKKTPIVVKDCPGFLVNRTFAVAVNEVLHLLEEGVPMESIDQAMVQFGFPMPPFILADKVGNDVNYRALKNLEIGYGERMKVAPILKTIYDKEWFGEKSGRGFYVYQGKTKVKNPELLALLPSKKELSQKEIIDRITLSMVNESARCLDEGVVKSAAHLDLALIYGIGFPPFRGGILRYADEMHLDQVYEKLTSLSEKVGKRFAPCEKIQEMGKNKKTFYSS